MIDTIADCDFCAQAPKRIKWTLVANMRDVASGIAELKYWAERDPNLVVSISRHRLLAANCSIAQIYTLYH